MKKVDSINGRHCNKPNIPNPEQVHGTNPMWILAYRVWRFNMQSSESHMSQPGALYLPVMHPCKNNNIGTYWHATFALARIFPQDLNCQSTPVWVPWLVSSGCCGGDIMRLRRLRPWSLGASCNFETKPKNRAIATAFAAGEAKNLRSLGC